MRMMSTSVLESLLKNPVISRIRRNHGLEHATLHVLSQRHPKLPLAGHSDMRGFWILGDVSTEEVESAVQEAITRLQAGEHNLAVHPNCGTNFVTSGILASLAAFVAIFGAGRRFRDRLERLPLMASLTTIALIISQPLGLLVQEQLTTSSDVSTLRVTQIVPSQHRKMKVHHVLTQG